MSSFRHNLGRKVGLTLIEVMLALTILGVGVTVLVVSAGKCLGVVRKARHYEAARRLLAHVERELQEELLEKEEVEESSSGVDFDPPVHKYKGSWELVREGEEEDGLFLVRMKVSWSERGTLNHEEVVTYLYAPVEVEGGSFESR